MVPSLTMEISLSALENYAKDFVKTLPETENKKALVFGLEGNLGAGKTTFVQHVARELGVKENVTSPTFVIAQSYETKHPIFKRMVHIDAYRLEDEEKDTIGFKEYIKDPENLIFVEWPSYMPEGMPDGAKTIKFETVDENTRLISADL